MEFYTTEKDQYEYFLIYLPIHVAARYCGEKNTYIF